VLSVRDAIFNYTWMPINIHRFIANIAFGGSVAGAYAAFKFPAGGNRRGARALRLDGVHRELRRDQRLPPAAFRGLLPREGDLRVLADPRAHDDGRGLLVALHRPGRVDREPLPRGQLLSLARDGAGRGGAAASEVHQVPSRRITLCFAVWATPRSIIATVSSSGRWEGDSPHSGLLRRHVCQETPP